jgi:hypothetical protein
LGLGEVEQRNKKVTNLESFFSSGLSAAGSYRPKGLAFKQTAKLGLDWGRKSKIKLEIKNDG